MEGYLLISEAAREVEVESHVLRYWEEELKLPIKRNEQGHRYYTGEDVEFFKQIKRMKEQGLQLKAIKMILKNGELNVVSGKAEQDGTVQEKEVKAQKVAHAGEVTQINSGLAEADRLEISAASGEDKTKRLQWLLQQLIREAVRENNRDLCREIKESVVKELDYQFRNLEEREEQRDAAREQREEEHFRQLDDLLRKKARRDRTVKDGTTRETTQMNDGKNGRTAQDAAQMEKTQKAKHIKLFRINRER